MTGPRIVIVGAGFAGWHCASALSRRLRGRAEVTVLNPTDYFLYLPLLPQVTGGLLDPARVTISLPGTLPHVDLVLGEATAINLNTRTVNYRGPEDNTARIGYDVLVIAAGSVNKLLPVPGIVENAHGFRGIPEALYLHDHLVRQMELAEASHDAAERAARLTFVVVGAGYTGTEVLAHGQRLTEAIRRHRPGLRGDTTRWLLLDTAGRVLPGLDPRLSRTATRVLARRGVDIRTGISVTRATAEGVHLSDGTYLATRTLVWCVGVRPDPLVEDLGLPTQQGRLVVDEHLGVPDHPRLYAIGDAAAVPDLTRPGQLTAMTAQHAQRQGLLAAANIAADVDGRARRPYRHHDLGFTVDLAGLAAAADPLHVPLGGPVASALTAGYHLWALPAGRLRVAADWLLGRRRQSVQYGLVRGREVPLDSTTPELRHHTPSRR